MGKVDLIYQAIKAGISAPKIIAKYGKKLYNKTKADIKKADEIDIEKGEWIKTSNLLKGTLGTSAVAVAAKAVESELEKKEKELEKNNSRSVKSFSGPKEKKKLKKKDPMSTDEIMKRQARITKLHQEEGKRMKRIGLDIPHYKSGGKVNSRAIAKKYFKGGMV